FVGELVPDGLVEAVLGGSPGLLRWLAGGDWGRPLPGLLPDRQREVRARVNATGGPRDERGLHERFFARAQAEPDRPALLWGAGGSVSYGELASQALTIAGALRARGLAPAEPAGVTVPRRPDPGAAALRVLAAGRG